MAEAGMTRDNVPGRMYMDSSVPVPEGRRVPIGVEQASRDFVDAANRLPMLWQLSAEFNDLVALLEEPEVDQAAVDVELERVARDIKAKAYGIAVVIQGMDNKAAMIKSEEQRLYAKRKAAESAADRLRAYTLAHFKEMGIDRLDYGTFTLSIRQNPQSVVVLDAALVPGEYQRTKIEISVDKRAVLAAFLKDGEVVPGTSVERGERLSIA